MKDRKQQVIIKAHELFIEKGYQATSIQDILEYSGISKGTLYNYFPSKSELFKAVFTYIQTKYEAERNQLLIGENLSDMDIFIKQLDLFMLSNKKNKIFSLVEEVITSNDPELKQFIKVTRLRHLEWMFKRFIEIFGEEKRPFLLDCAILFSGMLQQMIHYHAATKASQINRIEIIRYCVNRLKSIVAEVSDKAEQLVDPNELIIWLGAIDGKEPDLLENVQQLMIELKGKISEISVNSQERERFTQLLGFIEDEIINNQQPRTYLIESTLNTLMMSEKVNGLKEMQKLKEIIDNNIFKK